ncbi:MAG: glucose-6-phosphate isomerase [Burkholderiales bacterium]|jgi:glucose-6-phosphate isomerase|nr:glucose-6-phosphate isomerase [Burkholderiales bacterium]
MADWQRFNRLRAASTATGIAIDASRMGFDEAWLDSMRPAFDNAFAAMRELEAGAIANPDENRMVGHYWLRAPKRAPTAEIAREIESSVAAVKAFAASVHEGAVRPERAPRFTDVLAVGIGGSALGPQLVADALGHPARDRMRVHFVDNTDPDGIERTLAALGGKLDATLAIVTSKSGGTPETRNGMLAIADAYRRAGLDFARHAVAITMPGSQLDKHAAGWLARFPMFDWVGGRTSELSAVGLLPAALQGLDVDAMLAGAAAMDEATRIADALANPAALMAAAWFHAADGRGAKDMVVIPYKDRLALLARYLQQLVMESLGKREDLAGKVVEQGLAVYGNKGSTDQHAYVQQLRDGVANFFLVLVRVLEAGSDALEVEPGTTSGDYLHAFLLGTREAIGERSRASLTVTMRRVDAASLGALIALFERAVGLYASLVGINAYHQPGVEAGKKAAASILGLQSRLAAALDATPKTAAALAQAAGSADVETAFLLLEHLAANGRARMQPGTTPADALFATR